MRVSPQPNMFRYRQRRPVDGGSPGQRFETGQPAAVYLFVSEIATETNPFVVCRRPRGNAPFRIRTAHFAAVSHLLLEFVKIISRVLLRLPAE